MVAEKLWITELIPDYLMSFLFGDKNTNKKKERVGLVLGRKQNKKE